MRRLLAKPSRSRRAATGVAALLLVCGPLVACSQGSDDASGIPTFDPEAMASADASESAAAAEASASAAASAEAAGIVTAESLSTDRYEVTSIPENLDEQQTEILKTFINYDQVTWNIWFTGTGVENAQPLTTDEEYQIIKNNYDASSGEIVEGGLRIAITSILITSPYSMDTQAEVVTCADQSALTAYDAQGNDVSNPEVLQGRYETLITMIVKDGTWKVSGEQTLSTNKCTV